MYPYNTHSITESSSSNDDSHRHLNGRRFHASASPAYYLPNDDLEAARLDLQHYTWKLSLNGHLSIAPIDPTTTQRVLDIGTGTGIWCIEVAKAHPGVGVIGTDLSVIQPETKPGNCKFLQADAEEEWVFDEGKKFDFVHSRMLTMGTHDWRRYFAQCWENLHPGGWIQTGETQFPQRRAEEEEDDQRPSALLQWGQHCYDAAAQAGIDARASEGFEDLLRAQGFVNISKYELQWPIGTWAVGRKAKVIGRLTLENMGKAVPGIGTGLLGGKLGWRREQVEEFSERVKVDMERGRNFVPMVIHVAQKPFEA
ncbi:hypothetical protein M409DRAFT_15903 [Zasmidium cellare ATCC 36951]|uniref:Methyltransferase domain-containing protein n=1 Tax=Zasmidium cellare ATCC 36951 TaxID=1080233 RepID=A0A6A6D3J9_ZASCE|nr:uncharacterized protein M409DRAFT_15903 [Zasmidium cellare ATCC 36951]KAF2173625.1 hypothetical protein M409DRAFT_15903 [Zasmidium cellare ATCC 36951]